ncbi:MAG: aminotransferase class III-fold pyridoxal phosphate-dependent enzyme [Lysobacterales bacterium]
MTILEQLGQLRSSGGSRQTHGLPDAAIEQFAQTHNALNQAVTEALSLWTCLAEEYPEYVNLPESEQLARIQEGVVNFYARDAVNPYVSLAAKGPWVVTTKGAVIHDSGGYGMLGFGHNPDALERVLNRHQVMANIMTGSFSQRRLLDALSAEIGRSRPDRQPVFNNFLFLNSGSESVTAAARLSDVNAKIMTDPGGTHAGKPIKVLSLKGGFHGRTDRPAQFSDSSAGAYTQHLASFRDRDNLITVEPNNVAALHQVFSDAAASGVFIESFFMEPVMGEGNPGQGITPQFYAAARQLTEEHGSLLLVDSIQAGLRAHGCLSIVDYPGFEQLPAPDMETYSKALNAGQYPMSVLAMGKRASDLYRTGIYGNTMTANPRAMDIASTVLKQITPELRDNIRLKGEEFLEKLQRLAEQQPGRITNVQGTGLLFSCEVSSDYKAYGAGSLEEYLRIHGIGVIHGGENSLRFTPHFGIDSQEIDLIVAAVANALENGPQREAPLAQETG